MEFNFWEQGSCFQKFLICVINSLVSVILFIKTTGKTYRVFLLDFSQDNNSVITRIILFHFSQNMVSMLLQPGKASLFFFFFFALHENVMKVEYVYAHTIFMWNFSRFTNNLLQLFIRVHRAQVQNSCFMDFSMSY